MTAVAAAASTAAAAASQQQQQHTHASQQQMQQRRRSIFVGAIDQGTTSTRFKLYKINEEERGNLDHLLQLLPSSTTTAAAGAGGVTNANNNNNNNRQLMHQNYFPRSGWVEHDPMEILHNVNRCLEAMVSDASAFSNQNSSSSSPAAADSTAAAAAAAAAAIAAIGITNQRETTVVWDRDTGEPLHRAIVWNDARTSSVLETVARENGGDVDALRALCGLPLSTYFSGLKLRWLCDHEPRVRDAIKHKRCMFGTVDSWLIWNLTDRKAHVTDVTNASRTMLMNIHTLQWDRELMSRLGIPLQGIIFPEIKSCAEIYGHVAQGPAKGVPIAGCVGDQQSATIGQQCFRAGQAKNTYGTGCFMLMNTGQSAVPSKHGLLTTVLYQFGSGTAAAGDSARPVTYALEGSIAVAGSSIEWLKDNMGFVQHASEIEPLAASVESTAGVYFVPAFSGLFAPRWRPDARGTIVGLTQYSTKAHIARATLEAVTFQTKEVLDAMVKDASVDVQSLKVDGGMSCNNLLMQLQANHLGVPVMRPTDLETTARGAALCAAIGSGVLPVDIIDQLAAANVVEEQQLQVDAPLTVDSSYTHFTANISDKERTRRFGRWQAAVDRSLNWHANVDIPDDEAIAN